MRKLQITADGTLSARVGCTMGLEDWKDAVSFAQGVTGREGKVVFVFNEPPS